MSKKKHIADQYEFNMGDKPFVLLNKVVVAPSLEFPYSDFAEPIFAQIVEVVSREPHDEYFIVKDEKTGKLHSVYAWQLKLRI